MFRRTFAIVLSGILLPTAFSLQSVSAQTGKETQSAVNVRARVQKFGVARDARVEVRLRDNTIVKGFISAIGQDSFTVTDSKTGTPHTVAYSDVNQVKRPGGGLSMRTLVIIGAVAVAAVIVGVKVVKPVLCDGGAGC